MKRTLLLIAAAFTLVVVGRVFLIFVADAQAVPTATLNGDTNGDGVRDLSDAIRLLNWLFLGGPEPVAIAGSTGLEDRVRALEDEVARLAESNSPADAALAKALDDLKRLGAGEVWDFPRHLLRNAGAGAEATLTLNGAKLGRTLAFRLVDGISMEPRLDIIEEIPIPSYGPVAPGTPLSLLYQDTAGQAMFHGEVGEVSVAGVDGKNVYLRIAGFSKLHRLARGRHSRIYQGIPVMDIAKRLLDQGGFPRDEYELVLEGTISPARDYVVQHNQTDLEFLLRVLSDEGIYFFFVESAKGAKLRFGNGAASRIPATGEVLNYPGHLIDPPQLSAPFLFEFHRSSELAVGKVTLTDYDFEKVTPVFGSASVPGATDEEFDFGVGRFVPAELDALALRRLDLEQSRADAVEGASNTAGLRPGLVVTVGGTSERFNGKYLVTGVTHRYVHAGGAAGGGYFGNSFSGIPEAARYLPPLGSPTPAATGLQPATVTGPSGQRIYTDALGRVKVKFPWDREGRNDDSSSAWVRVAQNHAAGAPGFFLPEVGDEVIVAFEHGDINRPVVLGSMWNGKDRPPGN
jgi:type VI secretion system VgrG family protein